MRVLKGIVTALSCMVLLNACIKDEPRNNECDIESAWVQEGEPYEGLFFKKSQMTIEKIPSNTNEIVFTIRPTASLPEIPVHFTLTQGATIYPANGSPQDFSKGPVTYTVTSEDGAWKREYKVLVREAELPSFMFSFENVDTEQQGNSTYNTFFETDQTGNRHNIWASGNQGVAIVQYNWTPDQFPTKSVADGYNGKGVCLNTQYAGDLGKMMGKPIAAGNLFLGNFNMIAVLINPLKSTEFGIPMDKEPIRVTGYYKYKPGEKFTNSKMEELPGRTDEASIYAIFYRNEDENGNKVMLYGDDVFTNENIISIAQVKSLPATDEWTRFDMLFEGSDADPKILSSLGYNLTLVFSSSKDGASFEGAIGSTLYIDEVKVSFKDHEEE